MPFEFLGLTSLEGFTPPVPAGFSYLTRPSLLFFLEELRANYTKDSQFVLPRLWEWNQGDQAKVLKSFCEEIGIAPVKFHDLRANFITQMLNNGVPLSKVMAIVGHSSLKTTQGYLRLSGKDIEGATEGFNIQVPQIEENLGNVVQLKRR